MLVMRLEMEDGQGVYGAGYGFRFTRAALENENLQLWHPSPEEEPSLRCWWEGLNLSRVQRVAWEQTGRRAFYCAFDSKEQMLNWFPLEGLKRMWIDALKQGKRIYVTTYKVSGNQVKRGDLQVLFNKSKAHQISRTPLDRIAP